MARRAAQQNSNLEIPDRSARATQAAVFHIVAELGKPPARLETTLAECGIRSNRQLLALREKLIVKFPALRSGVSQLALVASSAILDIISALHALGKVLKPRTAKKPNRERFDRPYLSEEDPIRADSSANECIGREQTSNQRPRKKRKEFAVMEVLYATDRARKGTKAEGLSYTGSRSADGTVSYGRSEVSIPRDHKVANLESPSILKFEFRSSPARHVTLMKLTRNTQAQFEARLSKSLAKSRVRELFIFIHGYNVSFENAVRRTAQLAYDLAFDGPAVLYSWPSAGRRLAYMKDESSVAWTVPHLLEFLTLLASNPAAERIHVVAHSMGNRALTEALTQMAEVPTRATFRQIALAAPDIDESTLTAIASALATSCKRMTLYASRNDAALKLSGYLHGYARAGVYAMPLAGVDVVDASSVDHSLVGHSYFGDNRSVVADLYGVINHEHPAEQRFGLVSTRSRGNLYYKFRR
jgi:esterase/lipase superfamily enzyme